FVAQKRLPIGFGLRAFPSPSIRWSVASPTAARPPRAATQPRRRGGNACGSFDDLIGSGREPEWHLDPERPRRLQIDHEFELAGLYDREIGGLLAFENPPGIDAGGAIGFYEIGPVTGKPARLREFAPLIYRRQLVARRERHDLLAPAEEERIGSDEQRA